MTTTYQKTGAYSFRKASVKWSESPIRYLTPGERLRLKMRREGWKAQDIARMYWVKTNRVSEWVNDRRDDVPQVVLGEEYTWFELAFLARRRRGWTVRELAEKIGVSHVSLIKWEEGMGDWWRLKEWWFVEGWPVEPVWSKEESLGRGRVYGPLKKKRKG